MTATNLAAVQTAMQTFWSPVFMEQLRQTNIIYNLINRSYTGDLKEAGDTVKVNQINDATGQILTINTSGGARTFTPEALSMTSVSITADRRLVASFDIEDLVFIQSLVDPFGANSIKLRASMLNAINNQLNSYIYTKVAPTTSIASTSTLTAATVAQAFEIASQAKWLEEGGWYGLLAPGYYADALMDTTLMSSDFGATDAPVISGQMALKRFNFNMYKDNTQTVSATAGGLFFHPDWCYLVTQLEPRFQISSKHGQGEFAYVLSVDMVIGAILGIQGAAKHIVLKTGA